MLSVEQLSIKGTAGKCDVCEQQIYYSEKKGRWLMSIGPSSWVNWNRPYDHAEIYINYCPKCGKNYSGQEEIVESGFQMELV